MLRLKAANDNGAYVDCLIRFQGQFFDAETGLHYNRFRYYDPYSGEYLSPDPIGLAGGLRSYGYVADPTAWIDPLGLAGCGPSRGKQLREKYANLTPSQRRARMNQLAEANAQRRLQEMQNRPGANNAHYLDRHGAHLDLQSQFNRAAHGIEPKTGLPRTYPNGNLVRPDSTRFLSHRDQLNAINRAEQIFKNTGDINLAQQPISFGKIIGEGYSKPANGNVYGVATKAQVFIDSGSGLAKTAFPIFGS